MKTVRNAIRLVREFSDTTPKLGVSELSRRLNLDRATVHRMLRTLCDEHLMEQDADTKLYRLGPGVLDLAQSFLRQYGLGDVARHHLEALRDETGESVALQILQDQEVVCIATAEGRHAVRISFYVGERAPLHCTAPGMLFMAHMPMDAQQAALRKKLTKFTSKTVTDPAKIDDMLQNIRRKGTALSDSTYLDGARSVSAPVIGENGDIYAVVTIIVPTQRILAKNLLNLVQPAKATADLIAKEIDRLGIARRTARPH